MIALSRRLAVAGAFILMAGAAEAHITLETPVAAAGSTVKAVFRVPHGCQGAATTGLDITIPEGFYGVQPMPHAGWQITTETGPYATPFVSHGKTTTEGVVRVTFDGGNLPNAYYDEFVLRGTVGPDVAPGSVLAFPTVQHCENGSEALWGGDGNEPAPSLTITAAEAPDDHHAGMDHGAMTMDHGAMAMDHAAPMPPSGTDQAAGVTTFGALSLEAPFLRATLPGAPVGGGFIAITNNGDNDDRLVSATAASAAGDVQLHGMKMEGDVMKMFPMKDGIPLPAHETVTLKPSGMHLMLMQLKGPLVEGSTVDITLTFEKAGTVTVPFAVVSPAAKSADGGMPGMKMNAN